MDNHDIDILGCMFNIFIIAIMIATGAYAIYLLLRYFGII